MIDVFALALALVPQEPAPPLSPELSPPTRIEAGGKPIDTDVGHAAPCVTDFDGDGVRDLLVGQFGGGGQLRIYRNLGSDRAPVFRAHELFMAGGEIATCGAG